MNRTQQACLSLASLLLLSGCGGAASVSPAPEAERTSDPAAEVSASPVPAVSATPAPSPEPLLTGPADWMPENTPVLPPETEPLPLLADVIAETYSIPDEEREDTRYYYNYVDLNDDGKEEIFALVMGMYTSGTGGDSGLLVLPYAGMTVSQQFTLLRGPILVSDHTTGGAHDLIFLRSGGGTEPELVALTTADGIYCSPADAPAADPGALSGTAILTADLLNEAHADAFHTLAE